MVCLHSHVKLSLVAHLSQQTLLSQIADQRSQILLLELWYVLVVVLRGVWTGQVAGLAHLSCQSLIQRRLRDVPSLAVLGFGHSLLVYCQLRYRVLISIALPFHTKA